MKPADARERLRQANIETSQGSQRPYLMLRIALFVANKSRGGCDRLERPEVRILPSDEAILPSQRRQNNDPLGANSDRPLGAD
jgi:hypothetical protein